MYIIHSIHVEYSMHPVAQHNKDHYKTIVGLPLFL